MKLKRQSLNLRASPLLIKKHLNIMKVHFQKNTSCQFCAARNSFRDTVETCKIQTQYSLILVTYFQPISARDKRLITQNMTETTKKKKFIIAFYEISCSFNKFKIEAFRMAELDFIAWPIYCIKCYQNKFIFWKSVALPCFGTKWICFPPTSQIRHF